ncbi:siderophore ABC transporter substrate-binding protein [Paenibacillus sp. J5C_2022]|uniref:siderophore ABC transporter substrate-binding protein n=1 Tax=Paenibacillus sp. J5C2022 TaxID=2977129 RepID=UPI0021CFC631|nr:siderophore ABC transporter substrate-binding protein [Paenibacillus sp. J5C2022]MCU6712542.1 siderophore ABC transporter substrate-binding protein [Paenibacillus sp. J5C2022]
MRKSFNMVAVLLVFAMVLAACGSNGGNNGSNSNGNNGGNTGGATNAPATEVPATKAPAPAEIVVKHELGEAKVKTNPETVVVFDYGVVDTLDVLGVEVDALPKSNLPKYLEKFKDEKYTDAGTLFEPDFETIDGISPDLIIISGRASEAYEELNKIAPTVYFNVDTTKYMESFTSIVNQLGEIFGKQAEAEAELAKINASIKEVTDMTANDEKKGLFVMANSGTLKAYGPTSRFGFPHDVLGVKPADDGIEISNHGAEVTFEYVAEKNPDYLFVLDRNAAVEGEAGAKEFIENKLMENTNAFKNGKIGYLNAESWYLAGGGLSSVTEMIGEIKAVLEQ